MDPLYNAGRVTPFGTCETGRAATSQGLPSSGTSGGSCPEDPTTRDTLLSSSAAIWSGATS